MIVSDPNIIVGNSNLKNITINELGNIKLEFKNKATLEFHSYINEKGLVNYDIEYLTGQENRKISNLKKKIEKISNEIDYIKQNGYGNKENQEYKETLSEQNEKNEEEYNLELENLD